MRCNSYYDHDVKKGQETQKYRKYSTHSFEYTYTCRLLHLCTNHILHLCTPITTKEMHDVRVSNNLTRPLQRL